MRKSRFTDSQIMAVLKRAEGGEAVPVYRPQRSQEAGTAGTRCLGALPR